VALGWGMEKNRISSLAPRLSSAPDVVDLVDVEPTPHNPLLPTGLSGEGDNGASNALAGTPGQLFRPEAIEAMADELCRLAKEFKQRVGAQRLLPALGSLSAMGPLHGLLRKQLDSWSRASPSWPPMRRARPASRATFLATCSPGVSPRGTGLPRGEEISGRGCEGEA